MPHALELLLMVVGAQVVAWRILTSAVKSAERNTGYVVLPISDLQIIVDAALRPPAEPGSQEGMNLLCILTRSFDSGYTIGASDDDIPRQQTPASATHTSPESGPCGIPGTGDGGSEAGSKVLTVPAEVAQSASAGPVCADTSSKHSLASAVVSEDSVVIATGHGGNSEAESTTPDTPADLAHGADADLASCAHNLLPSPRADMECSPPADLAPNPPADLAPSAPADLVPDALPALVSDTPAELVPDTPADVEPKTLADLKPNKSGGGANDIIAQMVRMGAAKAAIAHFKSFPAPPAPGGDCRLPGLDRGAVAKFLCRPSWARGVLSDMRDNGGLHILVDLLRWGEGVERKQAIEAIALLAYVDPAARGPLRALGAITHLATQLEVTPCEIATILVLCHKCTVTKCS